MSIGLRLPACNGKPHTAPQIFGVTFPLCWRCTSIAIGVVISELNLEVSELVNFNTGALGFLLIGIGAIDGYKSYFTRRGTTNFHRIGFGTITGIGLYLFCSYLANLVYA